MLNKCTFIGRVGNDPEVKTMQSGDKVANLTLAVSESWKDKSTGERKEKTEWVRLVIFNQPLVKLAESYIKKGSKIYVQGQMETRSWEKDGEKKYSTEIVLKPFNGEIVLLDGKSESKEEPKAAQPKKSPQRPMDDDLEDSIPF